MAEEMLDVRPLRKPQKHPKIFEVYDALASGESFVLVNDHDPRPLRGEFERDHPGSHGWEYLSRGPQEWRVRISKLASTPLPRVLCDTTVVGGPADSGGALWKLRMSERDLDSNIISLPAGQSIDAHRGPDLDVMIHVLGGGGRLETERDPVDLAPGTLLWLPRRSRRRFTAGTDGLRYLTVHKRRQSLVLEPPAPRGS